jgi:uncharacterized surface protein with fasciclin (FAS1) repeats
MKKILFSFILTVLSLVSFAQNSVVDIIVNSADHDTLEAAVIAAELADDLSGPGPFTVFAPTDAAFAVLPSGTIETLLTDPTGTLAQILLYHVVAGQALSTTLSDGQTITTLLGEDITVTIGMNGVMINNATVVVADITATNGVVHVIDAVLVPQQPNSVSNTETVRLNIPNPVMENINIPSTGNSNVQIYTTSGQVVYSQNFNGSIDIDTRNLSSGIYLLQVEAENFNGVTKIVK